MLCFSFYIPPSLGGRLPDLSFGMFYFCIFYKRRVNNFLKLEKKCISYIRNIKKNKISENMPHVFEIKLPGINVQYESTLYLLIMDQDIFLETSEGGNISRAIFTHINYINFGNQYRTLRFDGNNREWRIKYFKRGSITRVHSFRHTLS